MNRPQNLFLIALILSTTSGCFLSPEPQGGIPDLTVVQHEFQQLMSRSEFQGENVHSPKGRLLRAESLWFTFQSCFRADNRRPGHHGNTKLPYKRNPVAQKIAAQVSEDIDYILTRDPNNASCFFLRADVKLWFGDFEGALSDAKRVLELNPSEGAATWIVLSAEAGLNNPARRRK